jgi:serine/threonine protein kinase
MNLHFILGAVYKAKWISKNRQVACKVLTVPPDKQHLEKSFLRELAAYNEVSGAYILKLYGFAIQSDKTTGIRKYLLIMEFMSRGSLAHVIKQEQKISLRRKLEMACHIASGMRKLHARHMIHRDIRPDNILVNDQYTAKIGDMGIARVMEANNQLTVIGCGHFMPPEFITGKYDQSLDIFTFGLTLNHLFTEKPHRSIQFIMIKVKLAEESPILSELIARCIHDEPSQRPSAVEIEATLQAYKRGFDKLVLSEHPRYMRLSTEDKNKVFLKFYEVFHPQVKAALERRFPPPPPCSKADEGIGLGQILSHLMDKLVEKAEKE